MPASKQRITHCQRDYPRPASSVEKTAFAALKHSVDI
jgi:hypothetical protein